MITLAWFNIHMIYLLTGHNITECEFSQILIFQYKNRLENSVFIEKMR